MNRKDFIKNCGFACAAGLGITGLMESCSSSKILNAKIAGDDLVVPLKDFHTKNSGEIYFKKYIVVQNDILQYPVCIYRKNENEYSALWMRCSHQGTELQVFGDRLQCPAHGSEFDSKGIVQNGPAIIKLRTFPVTIDKDQLKISLKEI